VTRLELLVTPNKEYLAAMKEAEGVSGRQRAEAARRWRSEEA
jgi:hypothetical protein